MSEIKVVVNGVGAAGVACTKIIMAAGRAQNIVGCDQTGALYRGRKENMNWVKDWYAQNTNPNDEQGTLHEVIKGADVFLGLSVPGVIDVEDVKRWLRSRSCLRWRIRRRRSCRKMPRLMSR
jgi:malate dehydrogenase (oxaloacetate-decarboxylating)